MELPSDTQKQVDEAEETKNLKKIEAALFISARYLTIAELVGYTDINPLLLKELLEKLKQEYKEKETSIEIVENNGIWKMDVREEYHKMINKMATGEAEFSKAEQETLAVIAYKQPVKQSIIVKIRGNKSYEHIKHFIDVGLLKSKRAGRTKELQLSENFYDYFNLEKKQKQDGAGEEIILEKKEPDSSFQKDLGESEENPKEQTKKEEKKIGEKEEQEGDQSTDIV